MVCGCYEELLNGLWLLGRAAEWFVVVRKSCWMVCGCYEELLDGLWLL